MKAPLIPTEVEDKGDKKALNLETIFQNNSKEFKSSPNTRNRKIEPKEILGFNMKRVDLLHQLNQKAINELK